MVIMLLDLLNMCVSACTSECAYDRQMRSRLPKSELPSNITHGLCFDPVASLLTHLLSPVHTVVYVCAELHGCMHGSPFKPSVLHIYTVLPLFPMPISPLLIHQCMQCRAYSGRTRLGSFPCSLCHQKSQRYTPLAVSSQPKAFFFQSVRDSCSRPRSSESSLRILRWILLGFWEVWAEWCML